MKKPLHLLVVFFLLNGHAYSQVDSARLKDSGKLNREPVHKTGSHPDSINHEKKMPPKKMDGAANGEPSPLGKEPEPKKDNIGVVTPN